MKLKYYKFILCKGELYQKRKMTVFVWYVMGLSQKGAGDRRVSNKAQRATPLYPFIFEIFLFTFESCLQESMAWLSELLLSAALKHVWSLTDLILYLRGARFNYCPFDTLLKNVFFFHFFVWPGFFCEQGVVCCSLFWVQQSVTWELSQSGIFERRYLRFDDLFYSNWASLCLSKVN